MLSQRFFGAVRRMGALSSSSVGPRQSSLRRGLSTPANSGSGPSSASSSSSSGSTGGSAREVTPATKRKNGVVAVGLLSFVVLVYYTAISKMKQTDDLETIINQEISK